MVEFHVDQNPAFQDEVSTTLYGGNLSVRIPSNVKPLICFGLWTGQMHLQTIHLYPEGLDCIRWTKSMIPKDEGLGVTISALDCPCLRTSRPCKATNLNKGADLTFGNVLYLLSLRSTNT
jgi:hypothetical protein